MKKVKSLSESIGKSIKAVFILGVGEVENYCEKEKIEFKTFKDWVNNKREIE